MTFTYTFAEELLTTEQVIQETITRCNNLGIDDMTTTYGVVMEVINDPCEVLNHKVPDNCLTDDDELSNYCYVLAVKANNLMLGDS